MIGSSLSKAELASLKTQKGGSRLVDVLVREMVDSQGDPALQAVLVYANAVTDEELRLRNIEPLVEEARRIVKETMADGKFVFVKIRRRKELATAC
jgi:hypothetical protein